MEACPNAVLALDQITSKYLVGDLSLNLVRAVIWQESHGNPWQPRFEPEYIWFYDYRRKLALAERPYEDVAKNRHKAETVLGSTEFICQSMSWGPMQIMGAAARERGFRGGPGELSTPECGIRYGCLHLWVYGFSSGKRSTWEALKRYNGTGVYADEVIEKLSALTGTV